jgi:hypothetical protein
MGSTKSLALVFGLALAGISAAAVHAQQQPPNPWQPEEPQGYWSQTWHDGFRAGADAANQNVRAGQPPSPARSDQFSHPDRAPMAREDFREGFSDGYQAVYDHFAQVGWRPTKTTK